MNRRVALWKRNFSLVVRILRPVVRNSPTLSHHCRFNAQTTMSSFSTTSLIASSKDEIPGVDATDISSAKHRFLHDFMISEKCSANFLDTVDLSIDLLERTARGNIDSKISSIISELANNIGDKHVKHHLFGTALRNASKSSTVLEIDWLRQLIELHTAIIPGHPILHISNSIKWSDDYIAALKGTDTVGTESDNKKGQGQVCGGPLNSYLTAVIQSTEADDKWFEKVKFAQKNLVRVLNAAVDLVR